MKSDENPITILFADDDADDCFLFTKALHQIPINTILTTVHDGGELMSYLYNNSEHPPDVLFLDLSMPRKTGFECLSEMKEQEKTKDIPVVVFSTSYERDAVYEQGLVKMLTNLGAFHFIRKSQDFEQFKNTIHNALLLLIEKNRSGNEAPESIKG